MIQQGLIVQRARFGRGSGGGRGNASLITLPFRPRETSLACSAYIRTNSLGGAVAAPVPKPRRFRFYHCPPLICLSCAFQRRACRMRKQCTMQVTLPLKSARPPFLRAAPGEEGRTVQANFTCSPEKAVRASLSVSLVVSFRVPFCK